MPGACACSVSSRRRTTRPSSRWSWCSAAVGRNVSSLDYYPVWGVDVARFGDDRTALAKRQANKLLEPIK